MGFSPLPRNKKFFNFFDQGIELVRNMSQNLCQAIAGEVIPLDLWERLKVLEKEADGVKHGCLSLLETTFVTPFEREDIYRLAADIDDVADALEAVAARIDIYAVHAPTGELRAMAGALDEMMGQLVMAVRALRDLDPGEIQAATKRVDLLEEKVDSMHRDTLRGLFNRHPDAWDLVRWKEIYDLLEEAADHGRHVSRTVRHILVRHS
jgi:uncharacterized protein